MVHISTSRAKAIDIIQQEIKLGANLIKDYPKEITNESFEWWENSVKAWRDSTYSVLKQLFDDEESLAKTFFEVKKLNKKGFDRADELRTCVENQLQKLRTVSEHLENGLYRRRIDITSWITIIVACITTAGGVFTGYLAANSKEAPKPVIADTVAAHKTIPGLSSISMDGYWEYACTSFDTLYQHGGRFKVHTDNGSISLIGWRLWKDIFSRRTNQWETVSKTLSWNTNWFFVINNQKIYLEYELQDGSRVKGYCTGNVDVEDGKVKAVVGNFYVLNDNPDEDHPALTGTIIFKKINKSDFDNYKSTLRTHNL
jgi:hypothetical protein